jgi:RND family efflux transporter MFP subunit
MKKGVTIAVVVGIIALILLKLANNKKAINELNKPMDRSAIKVPVTVYTVAEQSVENAIILTAVVKPENEANITINAAGKISSLKFDLGTQVNKGDVIGTIDNNLKEINLNTAQLLADKSAADYERIKVLYEGKAATEVDYKNAKYNYENAKNQVAQIRQQIADGSFIAPISGVIIKKNVEEGEFVNAGTPVARVVDISHLKTSVMVSEKDVYRLKEGMQVAIYTDIFPGKELKGSIRYISPSGDESHNYEVEIAINNEHGSAIKAGTFIRVKFDIKGDTKVIQIPKLALVEGMKNPYVYGLSGNKPIVHKLVLGRDLGDNVEVLSGIMLNEKVITSGQINLTESSIVEVLNSSN